jgi:hypothetical protein
MISRQRFDIMVMDGWVVHLSSVDDDDDHFTQSKRTKENDVVEGRRPADDQTLISKSTQGLHQPH